MYSNQFIQPHLCLCFHFHSISLGCGSSSIPSTHCLSGCTLSHHKYGWCAVKSNSALWPLCPRPVLTVADCHVKSLPSAVSVTPLSFLPYNSTWNTEKLLWEFCIKSIASRDWMKEKYISRYGEQIFFFNKGEKWWPRLFFPPKFKFWDVRPISNT